MHQLSLSDRLGRSADFRACRQALSFAHYQDLAGRRTKLTYPGGDLFIDYDYLVTGETVKLRENGATSGVGVLATLAYDDLGRRTGLTFGNGASQAYGYDPVSRLANLTNDLASTANDLTQTLAYNPASQIASTVRTGDAYAWTGHVIENKTGTPNGLNQLTQVGAKTLTHDARGNVTAFGTKSFTYSSENLLQTGPNGTTLGYDPLMRLYQTSSDVTTLRLTYDGLDRIAEHDGSNNLLRRYVHGPNMDEPFVWYEGSGTADRRFLSSDERGSIISVTDSAGTVLGLNKYDEFGQPMTTNLGVWGYTGQARIPEINVWYYKARAYDDELGRFLQPDPIGYADSPNLYPYVLNDPINLTDPLGLVPCTTIQGAILCSIPPQNHDFGMGSGAFGGVGMGGGGGGEPGGGGDLVGNDITVTGYRLPRAPRVPLSPQIPPPGRGRYCGAVPAAPPGVTVDRNINVGLYKRSYVNPLRSMVDMIPMFRTGGSMDYKTSGERYVDFGNFNYGAFSIAVGYDAAQTRLNAELYSLWSRHSLDQPRDRAMIEAGIKYAQCRIAE